MIFVFRNILWLTSLLRLLYILYLTCWGSFCLFNSQVTFVSFVIIIGFVCFLLYQSCYALQVIVSLLNLIIWIITNRIIIRSGCYLDHVFLRLVSIYRFGIMEYYYLEKKIVAFHLYWTYPWLVWSRYYFIAVLFIVNGIL